MAGGNLDAFVGGLDLPMFVVTTVHPRSGERAGCLVGFSTQCAIDPDRFLACLSHSNHTYRTARDARLLAVHGLSSGQRDLAALFGTQTGDTVDKFDRCAWRPGPSGLPILADCPRWFVGEVIQLVPLGNHTGFLLSPVEAHGDPDPAPLMFSAVRDLDAGHPA